MPEVEQEHLKELFHADTHCFLFIFNSLDIIVRLEFGPSYLEGVFASIYFPTNDNFLSVMLHNSLLLITRSNKDVYLMHSIPLGILFGKLY